MNPLELVLRGTLQLASLGSVGFRHRKIAGAIAIAAIGIGFVVNADQTSAVIMDVFSKSPRAVAEQVSERFNRVFGTPPAPTQGG